MTNCDQLTHLLLTTNKQTYYLVQTEHLVLQRLLSGISFLGRSNLVDQRTPSNAYFNHNLTLSSTENLDSELIPF